MGGPSECEVEVSGETFAEMGENCKQHVMEMMGAGDEAHQAAVGRMKNMSPKDQQAEFQSYQKKFDDAEEV